MAKHSKYKNTGLLFELLVRQITADTLNGGSSPSLNILKKSFANTELGKEYKLYEFLTKNRNVSQSKAEAIVSTITEVSRKLDTKKIKAQKYKLISEIKNHYNIDEFFGMQVRDYKPLAALYCLLEAQNNDNLINPQILIDNKTTILEHLTSAQQNEEEVKDTLIEEYSKYDKDLKLLTFKILLEKFNSKYKNLLPEQKNILKEFITSVNSQTRLRALVNEEMNKIASAVRNLSSKITNEVVKIKLSEVAKSIKPLDKKSKVNDSHLVNLMQYYDLVNELKSL